MAKQAIFILLLVCHTQASGDLRDGRSVTQVEQPTARLLERTPDESYVEKIGLIFERARTISILYTPISGLGSKSYDANAITTAWQYALTIKCYLNCSREEPALHRNLASALKLDKDCPSRFTAKMMFSDDNDEEIASVYVHESRQCIMLDGVPYYLPLDGLSTLLDLLQQIEYSRSSPP